jgi:hypothetical protein
MRPRQTAAGIADALFKVLEAPVEEAGEWELVSKADAVLSAGDQVFVIEAKGAASADLVGSGIAQAKRHAEVIPESVPLLVVPYMGDVGKEICREGGVSWLDLSGNANIKAPGMRVRIEGLPNQYKERGRGTNLFSPWNSRLARVLLLNPDESFTQKQLAAETGLDGGTISVLLRRYEEAGFIAREGRTRGVKAKLANGALLLNVWHQAYDFEVHDVRRGHIVARAGEELLRRIAGEFEGHGVEYAATGLAGAWIVEPFAMFRLVTLYVRAWPPAEALEALRFHEDSRGANVWFALPRDEGVFYGSGVHDGIRHVSAVQAYLDLKAQPERSEEAAEQLRDRHLRWEASDG